jgi:hypothetical protein
MTAKCQKDANVTNIGMPLLYMCNVHISKQEIDKDDVTRECSIKSMGQISEICRRSMIKL